MDTSSFFAYPGVQGPGGQPAGGAAPDAGLLADATRDEWDAVLAACQTRRFRPGETVLRAGDDDRAVYVLADGTVRIGDTQIAAPAVLGESAFFDGLPRAVTVTAVTDGEALRLDFLAWEALSARMPRLGRDVLLDLGKIQAARLRAGGGGFTG